MEQPTINTSNEATTKNEAPAKITAISSNGRLWIDYKRTDDLRRFLTPNGKIQARKRTGLNAREQRLLAQAIKRARYMGLLPYTSATM